MQTYKHPLCYEIAHGFFDVKKQVDTFEAIARAFLLVFFILFA
jgi:hypothetical protein